MKHSNMTREIMEALGPLKALIDSSVKALVAEAYQAGRNDVLTELEHAEEIALDAELDILRDIHNAEAL